MIVKLYTRNSLVTARYPLAAVRISNGSPLELQQQQQQHRIADKVVLYVRILLIII